MSSLYEYIKNSDADLLKNMARAVCKKLWLAPGWERDVQHEVLLSWLESDYDVSRSHNEILGFAFNRAFMHICEWRRRTVVPVTIGRAVTPEPYGIPLEALHGESLDRYIMETEAEFLDPVEIMIAHEELEEQGHPLLSEFESMTEKGQYDPVTAYVGLRDNKRDKEPTMNDVSYPNDPKGKKSYPTIMELLAKETLVKDVAQTIGVTPRTVYRRLNEIKATNAR